MGKQGDRAARGRPRHPDVLTPAEWRVLEELRAGRTNAEIAGRLGISVNTVRSHVSAMLAKLELAHRHELAAWAGVPDPASRRASTRFPFAAPLGWLREVWTSPVAGAGVIAGGVITLSIVAVVVIASARGDVGEALPSQQPQAVAAEPAALPVLPRAHVTPAYDPARFAEFVAVLYSRQDPQTSAYRPVQGVALLDPRTGEVVATVDVEGGGALARRRASTGELLVTEIHPGTGPSPDEFIARLLIFDTQDEFALQRMIDLPRALTASRIIYQPSSFVVSSNERYLYYLRYEEREGLADIMSIGIVDLDDPDPPVTVASLPRNCGGRISIVPAQEDHAVALCGQLHQIFLIAPSGEIVVDEDFFDAGIEHRGFAFGFVPPAGRLAALTWTGVLYVRGPDGGEERHTILPPEMWVHLWSDPFITPDGTMVIGTHTERTDGLVEGLVEFDLTSFTVTREVAYEPARSFALTGGIPDQAAVLTEGGDIVFPLASHSPIPTVIEVIGTTAEFDGPIALIP